MHLNVVSQEARQMLWHCRALWENAVVRMMHDAGETGTHLSVW
jgi:hypothetical protein